MKIIKYIIPVLLLTISAVAEVEAKNIKARHLYMFGLSASFKDSVVYVTDIQDVQGAWIDSKTKFLYSRDNYSYQLREHLSEKLHMPGRVCIIFFSPNKKKAEKEYQKIQKIYGYGKGQQAYDTRYLTAADFKFEVIEPSQEEDDGQQE